MGLKDARMAMLKPKRSSVMEYVIISPGYGGGGIARESWGG